MRTLLRRLAEFSHCHAPTLESSIQALMQSFADGSPFHLARIRALLAVADGARRHKGNAQRGGQQGLKLAAADHLVDQEMSPAIPGVWMQRDPWAVADGVGEHPVIVVPACIPDLVVRGAVVNRQQFAQ